MKDIISKYSLVIQKYILILNNSENSRKIQSTDDSFVDPNCLELPAEPPLPINSSKRKPINARSILWYMVFLGFAVDYMIRININITIVDMIIPDEPSIRNDTSSVEKQRISLERSFLELLKVNNIVVYNGTI